MKDLKFKDWLYFNKKYNGVYPFYFISLTNAKEKVIKGDIRKNKFIIDKNHLLMAKGSDVYEMFYSPILPLFKLLK
jgi:hypothetical protein